MHLSLYSRVALTITGNKRSYEFRKNRVLARICVFLLTKCTFQDRKWTKLLRKTKKSRKKQGDGSSKMVVHWLRKANRSRVQGTDLLGTIHKPSRHDTWVSLACRRGQNGPSITRDYNREFNKDYKRIPLFLTSIGSKRTVTVLPTVHKMVTS